MALGDSNGGKIFVALFHIPGLFGGIQINPGITNNRLSSARLCLNPPGGLSKQLCTPGYFFVKVNGGPGTVIFCVDKREKRLFLP